MTDPNNLFKRLYKSPYETYHPYSLYSDVRGCKSVVQRMKLLQALPVHNGCVNTISWSDRGDLILSGSDDQKLCITNANSYKVLTSIQTGHRANIFSARFLPNANEKKIISCSGDGVIHFTDLERPENNSNSFDCHIGTTYKIVTIPSDPNSFLSCGEDGTVRWYDLRMKQQCSQEECRDDILISCRRAVTALALNPVVAHQLVLGSSDSSIQMYDRRMLGTRNSGWTHSDSVHGLINSFTVPTFEGRSHRITSLSYSKDGEELLASFSSEYIYLFRLQSNQSDQSALLTNERKKIAPLPVKRLRLRGDWSDTGPNARPERELRGEAGGETQQQSLRTSLMQRMSYVLTRMLSDSPRRQRSATGNEANSQGEGEEGESAGSSSMDIPSAEPLSVETASAVQELMELQPEVVLTSPIAAPETAIVDINVANVELDVETVASSDSPQVQTETAAESDEAGSSGSVDPEGVEQQQAQECGAAEIPKISVQHCGFAKPEENEISGIKKALKCRRKQLLKKHKVEPTVSLHYSPQGVSSGVISMNNPSTSHSSAESSSTKSEEVLSSAEAESSRELSTNEMETLSDSDHDLKPISDEENSSKPNTAGTRAMESDNIGETSNSSDNSSASSEAEDKQATPAKCQKFREEAYGNVRCSSTNSPEEEDENRSSLNPPSILHKYVGHRNARTMIKEANFWGDNFIVSGSDCGHIFFWDRHTEEVAMILEADRHVVNCVQPHPFDPVLASSGIDYDVKLWAPLHDEPSFDEKTAKVIMLRNEVMLEETRDTITVPASFMIRMLASLSHLRSGNRNQRSSQQNSQ